MSIDTTTREALAAQQVNLLTGGRQDVNGCYTLLTDFWRSEADMCPEQATHTVVVTDYSTGFAVDGEFTPGETYSRVCDRHLSEVQAAPGFVSATAITDDDRALREALGRLR